jgi:phosphoserine aminotransferase
MKRSSKPVYFTPGPSQPYPGLDKFLEDAWDQDVMAISHRSTAFSDIFQHTDTILRRLMDIPEDYSIMFLGSATEAMERIIQGTVEQRSHHFMNGSFAEKWFEIAQQLGKKPTATKAQPGKPFKQLAAAVPADTELVCITQNETSTGTSLPNDVLIPLTKLPHRPLLALDVVSSAPIATIPFHFLDLVFFSVQKAFGLPAGLGVLIASPRAIKKAHMLRDKRLSIGSYHNLADLAAAAAKFQTPATPNVLAIYLLGRVAEDMLQKDFAMLRRQNEHRAQALYALLEQSSKYEPFVSDPQWRSSTVIVLKVHGGNSSIYDHLLTQGIIPGTGYGQFKDEHLRLANFPAISDEMFARLLAQLEG